MRAFESQNTTIPLGNGGIQAFGLVAKDFAAGFVDVGVDDGVVLLVAPGRRRSGGEGGRQRAHGSEPDWRRTAPQAQRVVGAGTSRGLLEAVHQVNDRLPQGRLGAGPHTLELSVAGAASNAVRIWVKE
jgi:hypothetical protein